MIMVLFAVAFIALMLGFGSGIIVARRPQERAKRLRSLVEELIDLAEVLPIKQIFAGDHRRLDVTARVMELEGEIKLVSNYDPVRASLYHNGVQVRMTNSQQTRVGRILNERIVRGALDSASMKLLEP
jgi:hypothetical protein